MKLNVEQRKIVELEPSGHMLIKGVAGSGKTTVAIRRIPFLVNHYCFEENDNVLLITFNKTLRNFIKYQYGKIEDNEQISFKDIMFNKDVDVKIITIDSIMYSCFSKYLKEKGLTLKISSKKDEYKAFSKSINLCSEKFPDIKILNPKYGLFLMDEVNWINSCNIIDVDIYQNIDRIGRNSGNKDMPQKLFKNSRTREAIFELMVTYNDTLLKENKVDFRKMNQIALDAAREGYGELFTHIIIDESQDLTKTQLEFIKCIYKDKKYSSLLFVADNTQSIYSHSWLGKGRPYTTLGYDMSGKSRKLSKNYRTTTQISEAAYSLIDKDESIKNNIDYVKPSLIDRHGHAPIYRHFKDRKEHEDFISNEISILKNDYSLSEIAVVAKERRLLENIKIHLDSKNIDCEILNQSNPDFDSETVKLVTIHSIKGLEFKIIMLIELNEGVIPNSKMLDYDDERTVESDERRLMYVGMTRANELLYMTSVDRMSKFISELDISKLRLKRDSKIRPFYNTGIPNYRYINKIMDINSKEEVVRQWFISELDRTYGYPEELIDIEFPVQQFSKKGYVDVVVNINSNGKMVPYIFIEIKQLGMGLEDAIEQLKSYIESNEKVRYGVVTDGYKIKVFDREFVEINDIPKFQSIFLPEKKEVLKYLNLKNDRNYFYKIDKDYPEDIDITEINNDLILQFPNMKKIPVVGDVVAGIPMIANENISDYVTLPTDWLINADNSFILNVVGDSMKNMNIDVGDKVVVNKQNTAQNGDVVIAVIDDEATMKKFMPMGDTILLISENKDYEPIQMRHDEVIINGKVIGVLK